MTREDNPFHRDNPQRTIYASKQDIETLRPLLQAVSMTQAEFVHSIIEGLENLVQAAQAYSPDGTPRCLFVMWAFDKLLAPEAIAANLEKIQAEVAQELRAGQGYYKKLKFKREPPNPRTVMAPNRRNRDLVRVLRQSGEGDAETSGADGDHADRPEVG